MRKEGYLARLFALRVMKSKSDAFSNHMVYMNLKNSNVKKMPYSTKKFSMQMSTQKWSRRGENGFGHSKNNHTVLLCNETRRKQKLQSCVLFFPSMTCPSVMITPFLSEVTAHCVFTQLIFVIWKGRVAPSFNIKTTVLSLLTLIKYTSKHEGPF